MGSSSSKQSNTLPQGQTITQTGLPSYFQPYVMDVLQRGQEASYQPYTPYKDQRIAGFTPGQIQAQEGVLGLQTPGQFGTATQFATQAGQMGLGAASQYTPGQFSAPTVQAPTLLQYTMGPAQQVSSRMVRAPQMNAAQTGFAPNLQAFEMAGPERVAAERATTGSFIQPGTASQYMSPYMQNVVDVQKQAAIEDAQKTQLGANLMAARQGTYGGARQLLAQTEREKALGQQLGQIQATGSQAAYDAAQRQFEAEQGRGLQAQQLNVQSQLQAQLANQQAMQQKAQQDLASRLGVQELGTQTGLQTALANLSSQQQANVQNQAARLQAQGMNQEQALRAALANQQAGLTVGQQNLASLLGTQQLGAQLGMQGGLANQQAILEAQRLQEQSRQYGAGLGLQGAGMGLEAARTLGGLGSAQQQAELQRLGAISGAGAEQQALTQQQMDLAYQDFLRQQQYPMSQLQQYVGLMSGLPSPGQTQVQTTYAQPSSLAGQLLGTAGSLGSAYMMSRAKSAKGGEVKNYNVGGLVAFAGGGGASESYITPKTPKDIAQIYGGDIQAIKRAIEGRNLDPTLGTAAALYIARMQEPPAVPPQGTVADQVFGSPTGATPAQGQGLGAVPLQQAQQTPQPMQQGLNTPDIATAADGGIIGYQDGGVARFNGREGSVVRSLDELKRLHRQALASGDRASANALQAEINRRSPSSRRSLYDTPKRDVDYSLFTEIPKSVVTPREIPLSGVLEKLGYDSESMGDPSLTYDPIRGVKTMGRGIGSVFESLAQPRTFGPISYDPSIIGRGAVAAYNKIFNTNEDFDPNAPAPASPPPAKTPAPSAGLGAVPPSAVDNLAFKTKLDESDQPNIITSGLVNYLDQNKPSSRKEETSREATKKTPMDELIDEYRASSPERDALIKKLSEQKTPKDTRNQDFWRMVGAVSQDIVKAASQPGAGTLESVFTGLGGAGAYAGELLTKRKEDLDKTEKENLERLLAAYGIRKDDKAGQLELIKLLQQQKQQQDYIDMASRQINPEYDLIRKIIEGEGTAEDKYKRVKEIQAQYRFNPYGFLGTQYRTNADAREAAASYLSARSNRIDPLARAFQEAATKEEREKIIDEYTQVLLGSGGYGGYEGGDITSASEEELAAMRRYGYQ